MRVIYDNIDETAVKRVTKRVARRLHSAGVAVWILSCNMRVNNPWMRPAQLQACEAFDRQVNAYEHYNCTFETGRYASYYAPAR